MIWQKVSLAIIKYMTILLFFISFLLATPWGSKLTLALLNNIDGITIDYHSGSFVQELKLTAVKLQLNSVDIAIDDLSTELDFFCSWQRTLCIRALKANRLSLNYQTNKKNARNTTQKNSQQNQLFEMPFAIAVNNVDLKEINLVINKTEIAVKQFVTELKITQSKFNLLHTSVKQLTVMLEDDKQNLPINNQPTTKIFTSPFTELPEIALPIALTLQQLHIDDIVVVTKDNQSTTCRKSCHQKYSQQWQSANNRLSGSWVNNEVNIRQLQTTTATFSITELVAYAKLQPPYQINSQFSSQLNKVLWWPEISDSSQNVSLHGSVEDLKIDVISDGKLALTSHGNFNLIDSNMPFNVTVEANKIPIPTLLLPPGTPSSLYLKASGDLKQQTIELTSQLNSYGYKRAQVKLVASHKEGLISISDLIFDDSDTKSQLNLQGEVNLLPTELAWRLSANSSGFSIPKIGLPEFTALTQNQAQLGLITQNFSDSITGRLQGGITSTGSWSDNEWSISINDTDVSGMINDSVFKIVGDISLNQSEYLQQSKLFVAFNDSELTLKTTDNSFWNIKGQLSVNNINKWVKGISGSLTSDFSITGQKDNPIIDLSTKFTQLSSGTWSSGLLKVEASYQPLSDHQIQLTLNNKQLKWQSVSRSVGVDDFVLNLNGDASKHKIKAYWLGDVTGKTSLEGQLDESLTHWQGSVEQSALTYRDVTISNNNVFSFNVDLLKKQATIAAHCWVSTGIDICLANQALIGDSGNAAVKLDLDLSVINPLLLLKNIELVGQVTGTVKATWLSSQPMSAAANFLLLPGNLKVNDDINEHQLLQWSKGEFTFNVNEQLLTSELQLIDINDQTLIHINSTLGLIDDYPVDTQIVLEQFNLQPFQSFLADVVNLQGDLTASIAVAGTLKSPLINGGLTLNNGTLLLSNNANTFNRIHTRIAIQNNKATIQGNFFLEEKEAKLMGAISWEESLMINLNLNAEAIPLVFAPQSVMSIAPDLNFHLKNKAFTISGDINVIEGSFNIEKLPVDSVPLSDDVIIADHKSKESLKKSSSYNIMTDIKVNIAKAFNISGQGLQGKLFGDLHISQKDKQPLQLFGRIQSNKGTYQAYGQKLQIEKGELTFNGPINNPYLNLRAGRHIKAKDIDVGIEITGLADSLTMELFSSPTMETPEVLSYLVRGQPLAAGANNSSAAASLFVRFGVTNSLGLFDQLEKIPLINNIAVDTEGQGEQTQATVSGYIGDNVYLKYGIGVYEPINELTVRMYLFNRFWLEIVSGVEQSTDLYYSFDID